jgi:2-keto-4-pentenoate hydratase
VSIDPRLTDALAIQFGHRRAALRDGARHVGWKLGIGDRERIGDTLVVGYLTSRTVVTPGGRCQVAGDSDLHADVEIAVEFDAAQAIAAFGVALEIVDVHGDDAFTIVADNVFHRAVAFGPFVPTHPSGEARLTVHGQLRASAKLPDDVPDRVRTAARILAAMDEQIRAGDRIITGGVAQIPIRAGDEVTASIDGVGSASLTIAGG